MWGRAVLVAFAWSLGLGAPFHPPEAAASALYDRYGILHEAPGIVPRERFGEVVAGVGDINGDCIPEAAATASTPSTPLAPRKATAVRTYSFAVRPGEVPELLAEWTMPGFEYFGLGIAGAGDVDGDACGDFVVRSLTRAWVVRGYRVLTYVYGQTRCPPSPRCTRPDAPEPLVLDAPLCGLGGLVIDTDIAAGGDVNGDGKPDVLISQGGRAFIEHAEDPPCRDLVIFHGGPDFGVAGVASIDVSAYFDTFGNESPFAMQIVGDVNGDGADDIAIRDNAAPSRILIVHGDSGFGYQVQPPFTTESMERRFAKLGDVNGDGYDDVVATPVQDPAAMETIGENGPVCRREVRVYFGSGAGLTEENRVSLFVDVAPAPDEDGGVTCSGSFTMFSFAGPGDLNGDLLDDLVVGTPLEEALYGDGNHRGVAQVFYFDSGAQAFRLHGYILAETEADRLHDILRLGDRVESIGDVNGDGRPEVLVSAPVTKTFRNASFAETGLIRVYSGRQITCGETGAPPYPGADCDGDGFGPNRGEVKDCDPSSGSAHPGAAELCDGLDNDCDGAVDEGFDLLGQTCLSGLGECRSAGHFICSPDGSGYACNAPVVAGTPEVCNGKDDDCDGTADDGLPVFTWYRDLDGDGYGDSVTQTCSGRPRAPVSFTQCGPPITPGIAWTTTPGDCNDDNSTGFESHPGAPELCDYKDNDCDCALDEDFDHVELSEGAIVDLSCRGGNSFKPLVQILADGVLVEEGRPLVVESGGSIAFDASGSAPGTAGSGGKDASDLRFEWDALDEDGGVFEFPDRSATAYFAPRAGATDRIVRVTLLVFDAEAADPIIDEFGRLVYPGTLVEIEIVVLATPLSIAAHCVEGGAAVIPECVGQAVLALRRKAGLEGAAPAAVALAGARPQK